MNNPGVEDGGIPRRHSRGRRVPCRPSFILSSLDLELALNYRLLLLFEKTKGRRFCHEEVSGRVLLGDGDDGGAGEERCGGGRREPFCNAKSEADGLAPAYAIAGDAVT